MGARWLLPDRRDLCAKDGVQPDADAVAHWDGEWHGESDVVAQQHAIDDWHGLAQRHGHVHCDWNGNSDRHWLGERHAHHDALGDAHAQPERVGDGKRHGHAQCHQDAVPVALALAGSDAERVWLAERFGQRLRLGHT